MSSDLLFHATSEPGLVLAFDCGGTQLKCALVDPRHGLVGKPVLQDTKKNADPEEFADQLAEMAQMAITSGKGPSDARSVWSRVVGIGIGMPGPCNYEDGVSYGKHKFPKLAGKPFLLKDMLAKKFTEKLVPLGLAIRDLEKRIFLLNDAMAFTIGILRNIEVTPEHPAPERFVGITLGTGLGASFLVNGIPASFAQGAPETGEIWDHRYQGSFCREDSTDYHYKGQNLDDHISALPIMCHYAVKKSKVSKEELNKLYNNIKSRFASENESTWGEQWRDALRKLLTTKKIPPVKKLNEMASVGDQSAKGAFKKFGCDLAEALRLAVLAFHPDKIAIGGQIAKAKNHFKESLKLKMDEMNPGLYEKIILYAEDVKDAEGKPVDQAALLGVAEYVATRLVPSELLVVPNEDGLGPSSIGFYVVRELLERQRLRRGGIQPGFVVVRNKSKEGYNRKLYAAAQGRSSLRLEAVHGIIQLGKKSGRLGFEESLTNLLNYEQLCRMYCALPLAQEGRRCVGVLDVGTPSATAAAWMRSIPRITLFDHMWSETFTRIAQEYTEDMTFSKGTKETSARVKHAIEAIRGDEQKANLVFLFPTFLTPEEYYEAWRSTSATVIEIGGVLGGEPPIISALVERLLIKMKTEWLKPPRLPAVPDHDLPFDLIKSVNIDVNQLYDVLDLKHLDKALKKFPDYLCCKGESNVRLDTRLFEQAASESKSQVQQGKDPDWEAAIRTAIRKSSGLQEARDLLRRCLTNRIVRHLLEIKNSDPIVFISGGGTAVWTDAMFQRIVADALVLEQHERLEFNLLVCAPPEVRTKFGLTSTPSGKNQLKSLKVEWWKPINREGQPARCIRFLGDVTDGTYQEIFVGIDLIVSRAGGGTANDAIACRVPICCVEEPHHWQVEAIRRSMESHGLTRTIRLDAFKVDPVAVIRHEVLEEHSRNQDIRTSMWKIANQREKEVANQVGEFLFNTKGFYAEIMRQLSG